MRASIKNYRQSPRKVRLVADSVRGKRVNVALVELSGITKRASSAFSKLISSAIANAVHNKKADKEKLYIKEITVDKGITFKRQRARARGRAFPINKRTSNINVVLEEK